MRLTERRVVALRCCLVHNPTMFWGKFNDIGELSNAIYLTFVIVKVR